MKVNMRLLIFWITYFFLCQNCGQVRNTGFTDSSRTDSVKIAASADTDHYSMPIQLPFDTLKSSDEFQQYVMARLYPIGWSKDNLFAWAQVFPDLNCSCCVFEVIIKNMLTDSIVWQFRKENPGSKYMHDVAPLIQVDSIENYWGQHADVISKKLNEFHILQQEKIEHKYSFSNLSATDYGHIVYVKKGATWGKLRYDAIQEIMVVFYSEHKGKKIVHEKKFAENPSSITYVTTRGHCDGPNDSLFPIILEYHYWGGSQVRDLVKYDFIGADARNGFAEKVAIPGGYKPEGE